MKQLIWYLLAGTKGGESRGRILHLLQKHPANAHQLAQRLKLDYKTIRHHLKVLEKNNCIQTINKGKYNTAYVWSALLEQYKTEFEEIWKQLGRDLGKAT